MPERGAKKDAQVVQKSPAEVRGPIDKWVLGDAQHRPEHLGGATNIQEHVLPKPPVGAAPNDKLVKEKHPQGPGDFVPEPMGKKRMPIVVKSHMQKCEAPSISGFYAVQTTGRNI